MSTALYRVIIVGVVLVVMRLVAVGVYGPALATVLSLVYFALVRFLASALLR